MRLTLSRQIEWAQRQAREQRRVATRMTNDGRPAARALEKGAMADAVARSLARLQQQERRS